MQTTRGRFGAQAAARAASKLPALSSMAVSRAIDAARELKEMFSLLSHDQGGGRSREEQRNHQKSEHRSGARRAI